MEKKQGGWVGWAQGQDLPGCSLRGVGMSGVQDVVRKQGDVIRTFVISPWVQHTEALKVELRAMGVKDTETSPYELC
jgi:hypothetical protein